MTPEMAFSLPGITELAIRMVSPSPTRILWSRLAIRDSAAIGSPWEPVQISVALLAGIRSSWSSGTIRLCGHARGSPGPGRPPCCAPSSGPRTPPCGRGRGAVSSTCWMRCTWLAKLETMTRRGRGAEDLLDRRGEVALGRREAGDLGVGGVGQEQVDPLLAQPGEAAQVGDPLVERELVHLEVAGVQDQARRRCGCATARPSGIEWLTARNSQVERARASVAVALLDLAAAPGGSGAP